MLIADCFASIRAKCIRNTGTHGTGNSVALPTPNKAEQSQPVTITATSATPETPHGHDAAYWQEIYEERAAIMEFDGGLPRVEAERRAKAEVEQIKSGHAKPRHLITAFDGWGRKPGRRNPSYQKANAPQGVPGVASVTMLI